MTYRNETQRETAMVNNKHGVKIVFEYSEHMRLWILEVIGTSTVQEQQYNVNTCETFSCYFKAAKELRDAVATYH